MAPPPSTSTCRNFSRRSCRRRFTPRARRPVQRRDVSLGLQHQQRRRVLAGAHHRGQTAHRDDGHLHEQPRQHQTAEAADRRSDDSLGGSAGDHGSQQLRQRPPAGRSPAPSPTPVRSRRWCTFTATRCCRNTTDIRTPGGHPGFAQKGKSFVTNTYNYVNAQEATRSGSTTTRWGSCASTFMPASRASISSATTATPGSPTTRSRCLRAIRRPSCCSPIGSSTPTASSISRTSDNPANLNGPPGNPDKHPFWIPEFFGDVITVNGKSWPSMEVQPRRYRFRFVNGSNARFFIMQMFNQQGVDMHQNGAPGPAIWQIGSDGGLLQQPGQAGRSRQRAERLRAARPIGNNIRRARRGQVPLPGARRARRRDRRLRRSGREDLHLEELRGHPLPQRQPDGVRRARRHGRRSGHAVQGRPAVARDATRRSTRPAVTRRCARAPIVNIKTIAPNKKRAADPGRGRGRHRQSRRPRLARRRRRSGGEPDQQHQVERQPRGDDHRRSRLDLQRSRRVGHRDARKRARRSCGRSPT